MENQPAKSADSSMKSREGNIVEETVAQSHPARC